MALDRPIMALIADHFQGDAGTLLPATTDAGSGGVDRAVLKCRPAPSRRAPATTMPYALCLRLGAAWLAALAVLLAIVVALRSTF